jgi:hypothetical protein
MVTSVHRRAETSLAIAWLTVAGISSIGLIVGCGCGAFSTGATGFVAPHGGMLMPFRVGKKKGLIEIVKKEGSGPITAEVSFYFYKENGSQFVPYNPAPDAGTLEVNRGKKVVLESDDDALVTPTGPVLFENSAVEGTLSVEFDDETRVFPLGIR